MVESSRPRNDPLQLVQLLERRLDHLAAEVTKRLDALEIAQGMTPTADPTAALAGLREATARSAGRARPAQRRAERPRVAR
jgi:hypothetical protein